MLSPGSCWLGLDDAPPSMRDSRSDCHSHDRCLDGVCSGMESDENGHAERSLGR